MSFFLSEEELTELLDNIGELGRLEAEAKTDYESSERELKLIEAEATKTLMADGSSATAAKAMVGTHEGYAKGVRELRQKQKRATIYRAKLEHQKMVFEAFRTYSANIRTST